METLQPIQTKLQLSEDIPHYYGNIIRKLFLFSGGSMLALLPFLTNYIPISLYSALLVILFLGIMAGLMNPNQKWVSIIDTFVSAAGLVFMGYFAIESYQTYSITSLYFWVNELLGITFLFILYFSLKTLRGFFITDISKQRI